MRAAFVPSLVWPCACVLAGVAVSALVCACMRADVYARACVCKFVCAFVCAFLFTPDRPFSFVAVNNTRMFCVCLLACVCVCVCVCV